MNWFTSTLVAHTSIDDKRAKVEMWGGCEHVQTDPSLLYKVSYENDSFGREGYCMCQACSEQAHEEEMNQDVVCRDCDKTVKKKDTIDWKWYDFHAPQGDEPLTICNTCKSATKHQERVARDKFEYEQEMSSYD